MRQYLTSIGDNLIAEYAEIETGRRNNRPELQKALSACRKHKAKLLIAKLDRLSRNVAFIAAMMDSGVEFVACDNPHATRLTLHILAAVAEHEREAIATRTKAALQAAKVHGIRLGRHGADYLAQANKAAALERATHLRPIVMELTAARMSIRQIGVELTARGICRLAAVHGIRRPSLASFGVQQPYSRGAFIAVWRARRFHIAA